MAEDTSASRSDIIMAAITIGLALLLAGIAISVLRSPRAKPCGCKDGEDNDSGA